MAIEKRGRGRTSKLTDDRLTRLLQLIRAGNYISTATKAAGISEGTFYNWRIEGEKADEKVKYWEKVNHTWEDMTAAERKANPSAKPKKEDKPTPRDMKYFNFLEAIKEADAEGEAALILNIKKDTSWQSDAWIAERRYRENWGRNEKVEVTGNVQHTLGLPVDVIQAKRDQLKELEQKRLEKAENKKLLTGDVIDGEAEEIA